MPAVHGKSAIVKYAATDISTYIDKAGFMGKADTAETSTFGVNSKKYVPGLLDGTSALEGPFDPAVHAILAPLFGTENTFVYYPDGTASGKPMMTVQAILSEYQVESDVNAMAKMTGSLQFTGDFVWATAP